MPVEDRIRSKQSANFRQSFVAKHFRFNGKPPALIVAQQYPLARELFLQNSILSLQVVNDIVLLSIDPARNDHQHQLPRFQCTFRFAIW